jgi:hypothetical protein
MTNRRAFSPTTRRHPAARPGLPHRTVHLALAHCDPAPVVPRPVSFARRSYPRCTEKCGRLLRPSAAHIRAGGIDCGVTPHAALGVVFACAASQRLAGSCLVRQRTCQRSIPWLSCINNSSTQWRASRTVSKVPFHMLAVSALSRSAMTFLAVAKAAALRCDT